MNINQLIKGKSYLLQARYGFGNTVVFKVQIVDINDTDILIRRFNVSKDEYWISKISFKGDDYTRTYTIKEEVNETNI